jgi:hypothetical protein
VGISVAVRNGEVDLSGVITDERQRQALKVAVENVPGVKAVHDPVAWVEPVSGTVFSSPEDEAASAAHQTSGLDNERPAKDAAHGIMMQAPKGL